MKKRAVDSGDGRQAMAADEAIVRYAPDFCRAKKVQRGDVSRQCPSDAK
ncbi:hypothetical protein [uncultured Duncaniella sp.]|nr:hypothetical protein [uncultured Duncaniella sp.]